MNGISRREFLRASVGTAGALSLGGCAGVLTPPTRFQLGMAGYTLNRFSADDALDFCQKHGFRYLCVKDFHLPYDSPIVKIAEFRLKCADHGVKPYGVGPISIYTEEEAKKHFAYAAALGVRLLVGVPGVKTGPKWTDCRSDRKLCEVCSRLADEYDIRFAIHNHGRNPKTGNPNLYPAVPETAEFIRDLSPRMGFCVDWAYTFADGLNCEEIAETYANRIFDGHVRCISDLGNGSSGTCPDRRAFDYDGIFAALRRIGYEGCLGLELANAFPANPEWIDQSRRYFTSLMG